KDWLDSTLIPVLKAKRLHVKLRGTASRSGTSEYNRQLSLERVLHVKRYLISKGLTEAQVPGQDLRAAGSDLSTSTSDEDERGRARARPGGPRPRAPPPPPPPPAPPSPPRPLLFPAPPGRGLRDAPGPPPPAPPAPPRPAEKVPDPVHRRGERHGGGRRLDRL